MKKTLGVLMGGMLLFAAPAIGTEQETEEIVIVACERLHRLSELLVNQYRQKHPQAAIRVIDTAEAGEMKCLIDGTCAISTMARPVGENEHVLHQARLGKPAVGIPIARDAVIVFMHPYNPVMTLTNEQIADVFTGRINRWDTLGAAGEYRIQVNAPERRIGTPLVFSRVMLKGADLVLGTTRTPTSREAVLAVAGRDTAVGIAAMGYTERVSIVPISPRWGGEPIMPTPESVRDGRYPLTHHVYWYVSGQPEGLVRELIGFALSEEGQRVVAESGLGFVPISRAAPASGQPLP